MSEEHRVRLSARLFVSLQRVLPQHLLTQVVHGATRSRMPLVKNALIGGFMRAFRPDMTEAAEPDPFRYASFNEFFTRALRAGCRPIDPGPGVVVSPVDGQISQIGRLEGSRLLQAKGHYYSLEALLGVESASSWVRRLRGGAFATLYLAPFNYHRVHMPLAGTLRAAWYIPGSLYSVNATTAAAVPGLFARNERVVCLFESGELSFAMVLVGALFVGSVSTVWHDEILPERPRRRRELALDTRRCPLGLEKGAEMGRFNMGSTVILVMPPEAGAWLPERRPGERISVGLPLALLHERQAQAAAASPESNRA